MPSVAKKDDQTAIAEALASLGAGVDPEQALRLARTVRESAESLELELVRAARARKISWSRIGAVYGLTKQGAQQRFRREISDSQ